MKTHTFDGTTNRLCDQLNRHRYRLYGDGSIVDKQENNKIVGWITSKVNLDIVFRMRATKQQKILIDVLEGREIVL